MCYMSIRENGHKAMKPALSQPLITCLRRRRRRTAVSLRQCRQPLMLQLFLRRICDLCMSVCMPRDYRARGNTATFRQVVGIFVASGNIFICHLGNDQMMQWSSYYQITAMYHLWLPLLFEIKRPCVFGGKVYTETAYTALVYSTMYRHLPPYSLVFNAIIFVEYKYKNIYYFQGRRSHDWLSRIKGRWQ